MWLRSEPFKFQYRWAGGGRGGGGGGFTQAIFAKAVQSDQFLARYNTIKIWY